MKRHLPGYTLLELVVVMAILAMATALAAPSSYRMVRSWQEATQVDDVLQQVERLPSTVRANGNPLDSAANSGISLVSLPENWALEMRSPLHILANGACSDAEGTLITEQQRINFRVSAPFCRVERL